MKLNWGKVNNAEKKDNGREERGQVRQDKGKPEDGGVKRRKNKVSEAKW